MAAAPEKVRWGFVSTALIATKNFAAVELAGEALVAVASRDIDKAREWARAHGAEGRVRPVGSYPEICTDAGVDALYVPLPCAMHRDIALLAAAHRKHLLLEKPVARSADELVEMLRACRAAGVQLMDGIMFMHHRRLSAMAARLGDAETFGRVSRVSSGFSFPGGEDFFRTNIRLQRELEPFGVLGDLGVYNIRLSLWAFGYAWPTHVRCAFNQVAADGLPVDVEATLFFDGAPGTPAAVAADVPAFDLTARAPRIASFHCSFTHAFRQWAEIVGSKGRLTYDDLCIPRSHERCEWQEETGAGPVPPFFVRIGGRTQTTEVRDCAHEAEMFRTFSAAVRAGTPDPFWPKDALQTQVVLDACMASGVAGGALVEVPVARYAAEV
jgi:predicted dehydrogenase